MHRKFVYEVLDSEREYQDEKWGLTTHSVEEWLLYIEDYLNEAKHIVARGTDTDVSSIIRKITAMGVCCMEQHGAQRRGE